MIVKFRMGVLGAAFVGFLVLVSVVSAQSECILNQDQCTCVQKVSSRCVKPTDVEGICDVEDCKAGWDCDCTGTSVSLPFLAWPR